MAIPEITAKKGPYTADEVELLAAEAGLFLHKIEASQAAILSERAVPVFFPPSLENRFRDSERNETITQILKYLLAFLDQLPGTVIYENKLLNPIETLRECVLFQVKLLLEDDVKKAVFNQINQLGSSGGDNVWDYQERIIEKNRELQELMAMAAGDDAGALFAMCLALEQFCLFWFDVKQGDLRRIRRSDIFIYKLAKVLQERYQQEKEEAQA